MEVVAIVAGLGLALTKAVDLIRNAFDPGDAAPPWVWNVSAFGGGLVLAFVFEVNAVAGLGPETLASRTAGTVLTGLAIAGGAGAGHEILDALKGIAGSPRKRPPE